MIYNNLKTKSRNCSNHAYDKQLRGEGRKDSGGNGVAEKGKIYERCLVNL